MIFTNINFIILNYKTELSYILLNDNIPAGLVVIMIILNSFDIENRFGIDPL